MNLQQLRTLRETIRCKFNVTDAANATFASQSGVSKQLRDLEDEIGGALFERKGKRLLGLTPLGEQVVAIADRLLLEADNIKQVASQFAFSEQGTLEIATTHTQARYRLPGVIVEFKRRYPGVKLIIRQAYTNEIPALLADGSADVGIATDVFDDTTELESFPFYQWEHVVVAPTGHPLTREDTVTIGQLAQYPIVTYDAGLTGRRRIDDAFEKANAVPDISMTALDADVIKTYVQLGLGVGIVAAMAFDPERDSGLHLVNLATRFPACTTSIAVRRGRLHRSYVHRFIELCAPHVALPLTQGTEPFAGAGPTNEARPASA